MSLFIEIRTFPSKVLKESPGFFFLFVTKGEKKKNRETKQPGPDDENLRLPHGKLLNEAVAS